jgi:hypothetical protein
MTKGFKDSSGKFRPTGGRSGGNRATSGHGSSMSEVRRRRGQDKTLFGPSKSATASEHIKIDTPAHADESIGWLNGQWEGGTREQRVKAVEYSNEAANRAFVTASNPNVSPRQREEASKVYATYRVWTDAHKGKE